MADVKGCRTIGAPEQLSGPLDGKKQMDEPEDFTSDEWRERIFAGWWAVQGLADEFRGAAYDGFLAGWSMGIHCSALEEQKNGTISQVQREGMSDG